MDEMTKMLNIKNSKQSKRKNNLKCFKYKSKKLLKC